MPRSLYPWWRLRLRSVCRWRLPHLGYRPIQLVHCLCTSLTSTLNTGIIPGRGAKAPRAPHCRFGGVETGVVPSGSGVVLTDDILGLVSVCVVVGENTSPVGGGVVDGGVMECVEVVVAIPARGGGIAFSGEERFAIHFRKLAFFFD